MIPYFPYKSTDENAITIEIFHTMESVPVHRHDFQEFVLITKGSCIHQYKNISMPLIPGDVFLIPPHQEHAYTIETPLCMYNCQFYPTQISNGWDRQFGNILDNLAVPEENDPIFPADLNRQNIIHLSIAEAEQVQRMMNKMLMEQKDQLFAYQQVKQDYLNLILVIITRARMRQYNTSTSPSKPQHDIVLNAQKYIENHLTEKIDFAEYARAHNYSPGHFRSIFKSETGLPPVEYLNRLRIVRAIEYLKVKSLAMSDVSSAVGIYDANYFSRLFRKKIGYSPSEFRKKLEEK